MKKLTTLFLVLCMTAMTACGGNKPAETKPAETEAPKTEAPQTEAPQTEAPQTEAQTEAPAPVVDVMSHEEYVASDNDSPVCVETYVQACQGWWEDNGKGVITVYAQSEDGAYFLYNMACSQEDSAKLVPGTKIKVTGFKAEWSGEVEIVDATFEFEEGSFVAEPVDVTALLGTDELIAHQNEMVTFTDMKVVAAGKDDAGNDLAYMYKWDNSGSEGDDLYFSVESNGQTYSFTVESYLCGPDTDVYKAVKELKIGDTVDLNGFLYWYEGVNPHITGVTVK